ncbi:type II secretion system GspH family protein [Vibrio sp. JC009]|uniref:type II secretion system protein n=1 Tax=Vibrio sp. JC009 TaxID=2912314 RepID=UPI0023AF7DAE|nr:type II secretion system protein [Vibrio sp. JC009]WED21542.1 type II secretion system GspH family protein [Vibrio sp. JC009]
MKIPSRYSPGFTLIELVVVIILLGIVSVYAASRYMGKSGFSAYAAQEQAISVIRQVQLGRMYSNVSDSALSDRYKLQVSSSCLGSVAGCADGESSSDNLVLDDDLTISTSSSSPVLFDLLGNPASGGTVTITISSDNDSVGVCINEQGYVYGC